MPRSPLSGGLGSSAERTNTTTWRSLSSTDPGAVRDFFYILHQMVSRCIICAAMNSVLSTYLSQARDAGMSLQQAVTALCAVGWTIESVIAGILPAPAADTSPVIHVLGLVKRYGDTTAVDGISFEVRRGEVFGILGPNGAGKTTPLEMIEGLRKPDSGRITLLGLDPGRRRAAG